MLKKSADDSGFTLIETVVASAIILVCLVGFSGLMMSLSASQRLSQNTDAAQQVLTQEMEHLATVPFDDLMKTPSPYTDCTLTTSRRSAQAVRPADTVNNSGLTVQIARTVTWVTSGDPVECTSSAKDRDDMKRVAVTVTWADSPASGSPTHSMSAAVLRSRFLDAPSISSAAPVSVLLTTVSTASTAPWTATFGGYTSGVFLDLYSGHVRGILPDGGRALMATTVTGLNPGHTYTAVLNVKVPAQSGSTPVTAVAAGVTEQGLVPADGQWHVVTVTWAETGTSRVVGVASADGYARSNGVVEIQSCQVYAVN